TRNIEADKQKAETVLQSDKEKYTTKEYNSLLKSIEKMNKKLEEVRQQFEELSKEKEEMIKLEAIAFDEKSKVKVELDKLKNPSHSPRPDEIEKNKKIVEEEIKKRKVEIRNEYRRDKLNFLDQAEHFRKTATISCKREAIAYKLSTLEVREKLALCQVALANSSGTSAIIGEAATDYSTGRNERKEEKKLLDEELITLQKEEIEYRAMRNKRWTEYNETQRKYGSREEIDEEINIASEERSAAEAEMYRASEEFRNYSNIDVIKARNNRSRWLITLMCFATQNKTNTNEMIRWAHQEYREQSKNDISKETDLGIPDALKKKIPKEISMHVVDMCRILINDKPPALRAIKQKEVRMMQDPTMHCRISSNPMLFEDFSRLTSTPRESTTPTNVLVGSVEEEIVPLSPRWS